MELSQRVVEIRRDWAISDAKRDEGLTTPENIVRYDDLSYGPDEKWNKLDIYHLKGVTEKSPTIISIHGGGWVYGDKELYQHYCMRLAQRGFTVVNFSYRLAPENKYPAGLTDINSVFAFLKDQGEKYMVDTDKLFVVGDSAGAQFASQYLAILTNPDYAKRFEFTVPDLKVRAVALNCGLYDFKEGTDPEMKGRLLDYAGEEKMNALFEGKEEKEDLYVIPYLTGNFPPAFVMSCENDFLLANAKPMYDLLTSLSVKCELKIYGSKDREDIAHVFHVNCKLKEADQCNDDECAFFRSFL